MNFFQFNPENVELLNAFGFFIQQSQASRELREKVEEQAKKIEELEKYIKEGTQMCVDNINHQKADCEKQKKDIKQKLCFYVDRYDPMVIYQKANCGVQ